MVTCQAIDIGDIFGSLLGEAHVIAVKARPKQGQVRMSWGGVLLGSEWQAETGIRHLSSRWMHVFEWRDEEGLLRGVLTYGKNYVRGSSHKNPDRAKYDELFMMTDPKWRRRGIMSNLLREASRHLIIDFQRQSYTLAGAAVVNAFLRGNNSGDLQHHPVAKRRSCSILAQ
jgi:GNAT superfamily N-acetyltransferase